MTPEQNEIFQFFLNSDNSGSGSDSGEDRVTEDNETRLTEDGETRIIE